MAEEAIKIVVLGGGYAGVMAAVRIAGKTQRQNRQNTTVTLVSGLDRFVERPRLHEQAAGAKLNGRPLAEMVAGTKARFVQGWARAIRADDGDVLLETKHGAVTLPYDYLIAALGSHVDRDTVDGVDEHAYTLDSFGPMAAAPLQERLQAPGDAAFRLIVVGGGATGIEAAAQFKSAHPQAIVTLVTRGEAGAFKGARIRQHVREALAVQRIAVAEQRPVTAVEAGGVVTATGTLPADVVVWAGGFRASSLAKEAGVRVNARNQIVTDPFLRSLTHPEIFAVGDMAAPLEEPGAPMRMSLFTALVSGAQAADNIVAVLKGQTPRPLSFAWYGQAIALGPNDAVGFATYPADTPVGPVYRGRTAVTLRRFFVWYLKAALELERRLPGFFFWNGKRRYARLQGRRRSQTAYQA